MHKEILILKYSVFPTWIDLLAMEQGKHIHGYRIWNTFKFDVDMGITFVDIYAKCGDVAFH